MKELNRLFWSVDMILGYMALIYKECLGCNKGQIADAAKAGVYL